METSPDFQQLWVARGRTTKPTLVPPQFHTDYIKKGVLFLLESGVGEFREGNAPHSSTLAFFEHISDSKTYSFCLSLWTLNLPQLPSLLLTSEIVSGIRSVEL